MLKVFSISRDKKFYNIGEEKTSAKWYGYSESCSDAIAKIQWKDEVECTIEKIERKDVIVAISKVAETVSTKESNSNNNTQTKTTKSTSSFQPKTYNNTSEQIKQLAIGHMVSRTIIGLQASIDINNMCSVIDTLWEKYSSKVNGN